MTTRLFVPLLLLALLMLSPPTAIAQDGDPRGQPDGDTGEAAPVRHRLAWTWTVGKTMRMRVEQTQTEDGPQGKSTTRTTQVTAWDVLSRDADTGFVSIRLRYVSAHVKINAAGMTIEYDSENEDHAHLRNHPAVKPVAAMVGQHLTVVVTDAGEVQSVTGADEIFESVFGDFLDARDPQTRAMVAQMRLQISNATFREMLKGSLSITPDKPVAVGDSWSLAVRTPLLGIAEIVEQHTLALQNVAPDDNGTRIAHLRSTGTVAIEKLESVPADNPYRAIEFAISKSTIKAQIHFNVDGGHLQSAQSVVSMTMDITPPGGGVLTQNVTVRVDQAFLDIIDTPADAGGDPDDDSSDDD